MKNRLYLLSLVILSFAINGCKRGCLDSHADNYEYWANWDDGSCRYEEAKYIIYTASKPNNIPPQVSVELNGEYLGEMNTYEVTSDLIHCRPNDYGFYARQKINSDRRVHLRVYHIDQDTTVFWDFTKEVYPFDCNIIRLE